MPSVKKTENFTLSFLIWILFTTLPCHVVLLGLGILCQISVRASALAIFLIAEEKKPFDWSLLSIMLALGLSCMGFIMLRYVPSLPYKLRVFIRKGYCLLSNVILHLSRWSSYFRFLPINARSYLQWFGHVEPSLNPRDKSHLVMVYNPFPMVRNFGWLIFGWEFLPLYSSWIVACRPLYL